MYRPQFSDNLSLKMGTDAEHKFDKIANLAKWYSKSSTPLEQRQHIDRHILKDQKKYSVEIKAMKKISRSDVASQDKYIWIELHGVHPNDKGWLYGGKAGLIAFEMRYGFLFVERTKLINLVNKIVNFNSMVNSPGEAVNKVYLRRANSDPLNIGYDKVTLIDSSNLEDIAHMKWIIK